MRYALAAVGLSIIIGCSFASTECSGWDVNPHCSKPCVRITDNGNGTTTWDCGTGGRWLDCTNPDCAGIASNLTIEDTDLSGVDLQGVDDDCESVIVTHNPALEVVWLPGLISAHGLAIDNNPILNSVALNELTSVGSLDINHNELLEFLDFPGLVSAGALTIDNNAALRRGVELISLTTVGSLTITDNTAFPQCMAIALKDHLVAEHGFTGSWTISGNDTTATCP